LRAQRPAERRLKGEHRQEVADPCSIVRRGHRECRHVDRRSVDDLEVGEPAHPNEKGEQALGNRTVCARVEAIEQRYPSMVTALDLVAAPALANESRTGVVMPGPDPGLRRGLPR
jgi:hypothetical protein